MSVAPMRENPQHVLKQYFGYDSFRPGQEEIVAEILAGKDVLAVMPTGAGKSICYQIPAMMFPGITLVISPLISLMQDQVQSLNEAGVACAFINSSLNEREFMSTVEKARAGDYKIIYVAPERLMNEGFRRLAAAVDISMVTVDEAHCISQWGQDFRPSYVKIVEFIEELPERPIISAFTATATERVREDILCTLGLVNPYTVVTGFDRSNLFFQVDKPVSKDQYILDYVSQHAEDSGIIYCATRKNVEKVYELLLREGYAVAKYHGGMNAQERKQMQDDFVYDYTSIVVATNAFGMGIDKSNVRYVIHYNMPQSMENYYQEAGRAGRDGMDSQCILLFSPQDIVINRLLIEHRENPDMNAMDMANVLELDNLRLKSMETYCYTTDCLRNYILSYFGEHPKEPCGNCSNCLREFEEIDMTREAKQIINCVYEAHGRYGKNIIIDTLVGAKTARLMEIGATEYRTYGVLKDSNKNMLKRLLTQMLMDGYLMEAGNYHVIHIGPEMSTLKDDTTRVMFKITEEDKREVTGKKASAHATSTEGRIRKGSKSGGGESRSGKDDLTASGYRLFEKLRELRLEIAREEKKPPYIVFSDKTLVDMCVKRPADKNKMLDVTGVGEAKYEKYGEKFLAVIVAHSENNK